MKIRFARQGRALLGAALGVVLAGCGGGNFDLQISRNYHCGTGTSESPPSTEYLVVRVDGDDMDPVVFEGGVNSIEFDPIPAGKNRVIRVQAFSGADKREQVAAGQSQPFEVKGGSTESVRVFLYPTLQFSMLADPDGNCAQMRQARAGHTAVRMKDGRVLIAGGFQAADGEAGGLRYLSSAEIYDPATGRFHPTADMPGTRAFAAGALLADGRVIVIGGEWEHQNTRIPLNDAAIFDPRSETWQPVETRFARRGHTATFVPESQQVLVVGGVGRDGKVVTSMEYFDPRDGAFYALEPVTIGGSKEQAQGAVRAFHTANVVDTHSGSRVVLTGGIRADGTPTDQITLIQWGGESSRYLVEANRPQFRLDRTSVGGAAFVGRGATSGWDLVISGGFSRWDAEEEDTPGFGMGRDLSRAVQIFDPLGNNSPTLHEEGGSGAAVVGACGVGHRRQGMFTSGLGINNEPTQQGLLVTLDDPTVKVRTRSMGVRRAYASCTDLGDGRALIVGGLRRPTDEELGEVPSGGLIAEPSAEIFVFNTPAP